MAATRAQIRERARLRADHDRGKFPTDDQYNLYIDEACKDVFADLVMSGWPADFTSQTISYNGASTGQLVAAGADVFGVHGVYTDVGGQRVPLRRLNEGQRALLTSGTASASYPEYYDLRVGTSGLLLYLFPRVAGTVYVDYIPDHTGLSSDAASWRGPARSDELVVLSTARKAVLKEGQPRAFDASRLKEEYEVMLDKVKLLGSWLDLRNAAEIRIEGTRNRFDLFDYDAAGPGFEF